MFEMTAVKTDKQSIRFSLRALLLTIAIVALALWAIPVGVEWYEWRRTRAFVDEWFPKLLSDVKNHRPNAAVISHRGESFGLYTFPAPGQVVPNDIRATIDYEGVKLSGSVRTDAIFVRPPGEWARTPDEAFQLLMRSK